MRLANYLKGARNEPSSVCGRDNCYGRALCGGRLAGDPMTNENKKKLALLLEERIDDCIEENLSKAEGETCRLDCPLHEKCNAHYVLFEVLEELTDAGIYITEEDRNA